VPIGEDIRFEPPHSAGALEMTAAFHRFLRDTLLWKCSGLTEEQLRWSPVPSGTSLLKLLKHSTHVERWWIARYIGRLDVPMAWSKDDPDGDWRLEPGETYESLRDLYIAEGERSRDILSGVAWEDVPPDPTGRDRHLSVGWIMTHMVEEVARHCGHADLIRELLDGETGE
jgi:uncharacterized damage-inducible protein DinB